jgi:cytochrome-b5 reductase
LIFLAGGAGITPLYSLSKGILSDPSDRTRIQLLWGVNGIQDIVLKNELDELEKQYPDRLRVAYTVSRPQSTPESSPNLSDDKKMKKGYVNRSLLHEAISQCHSGRWGDAKGTKIWLCGPPLMEKAMTGKEGVLASLGLTGNQVFIF